MNSFSRLDSKLPLLVAVTGHRNLVVGEVKAIRDRVRKLFVELQQRYPDNRLSIMSPLAEGADMLVAEIAVELSLELIVPLPKPREDYLQDFRSEAARAQFEHLCGQASHVFELPNYIPPAPQGQDELVWNNDYPYARLGAFLCGHCHILLALWDGKSSGHMGGTAQVVKFHLDDVMPGFTPTVSASQKLLIDDESDLIFHLVCSRNQPGFEPHPEFKPLDWWWCTKNQEHLRSKELPPHHALILQRSAEFSADAVKYAGRIRSETTPLLKDSNTLELPAGIESIDRVFRIADFLAIRYQKLTILTLRLTHVLAFLMGLMFILYSDFETWRIYLLAFLGFFITVSAIQLCSKRGAWHRKYLDYRALAEGLRVQFYWACAGVRNEKEWRYSHDGYLQSQDPEFGWVRNVMRAAGIQCDASVYHEASGLDFAVAQWIGPDDKGQLGYFARKAEERGARHTLTERLGRLSLAISVFIVFVFIIFGSHLPETAGKLLTLVMGATLLLYGVREGYAYATAEKELIKQYQYMQRIYATADRGLKQAQTSQEKRQILLALGQTALDEHADWILMHRERSVDEREIWLMGS